MCFLYAILIGCGVYFVVVFSVFFIIKCFKYVKGIKRRRNNRIISEFMVKSIPELYRYFTMQQRKYCLLAPSFEEACRRYREVVTQNPDIVRAYFNDLKAEMEAETQEK